MNQNGNKRSASFNPSLLKQPIAGFSGQQQQPRGKSISLHRKSQALKANEDDILLLQSCYVSREDSVFQMRVSIMQILENIYSKSPTEIQNAIRQSCSAIICQETHRIAIEDAILVKYISKNAPLIYLDAKNCATKMIIFRLCSCLNKINNAYFQKIQYYFPRLAELIQQEQCQWNSSFKEALSSLLALSQSQNNRPAGDRKEGVSLDTVLSFITSRSRQRFQKEQTKFAGFPTSYFGLLDKTGSLPRQSDRSNKNEKFYLEKLLQNPYSFAYSKHLMIKYLIHHDKTGLPQSLCIQVKQLWKNPYDILNLDEGNSNNSSSFSIAQSSSLSSLTKASTSFESVWEIIISNYDKSLKEMHQSNKQASNVVRLYHDQYSKWKQSQAKLERSKIQQNSNSIILNHYQNKRNIQSVTQLSNTPHQNQEIFLSSPCNINPNNHSTITDIQGNFIKTHINELKPLFFVGQANLKVQEMDSSLNNSLYEDYRNESSCERLQDICQEDEIVQRRKQETLELFAAHSNSRTQSEQTRPLTTDRRESDQISNSCLSNIDYPEFMSSQNLSRCQLSRVIVSEYSGSQRNSVSFSVKGEGYQANFPFKNLNSSKSFNKGKREDQTSKQIDTKLFDLPTIKGQSDRLKNNRNDSFYQPTMKSATILPRGSISTYSKPELSLNKNIFIHRNSLQDTFSMKTDSLELPGTFFKDLQKNTILHPISIDPCNFGKIAQLDKAIALNSFHVPVISTTKSLQRNNNIIMPQSDKESSVKKNTSTRSINAFKAYDFSSPSSAAQLSNLNIEKKQKRKIDLSRDLLKFDDQIREKQNMNKKEDKQIKYCNLNLDSSSTEQFNSRIKKNKEEKNAETSGMSKIDKPNLEQKYLKSINNYSTKSLYKTPKQAFLKYKVQSSNLQKLDNELKQTIYQQENQPIQSQNGQLKFIIFNNHYSQPQQIGLSVSLEEAAQQIPTEKISPINSEKPQYAGISGRLSSQI